jgi:hypothetical protein
MLREDGTAYPVLQDAVKEANQATLDYFSSQTQHSH